MSLRGVKIEVFACRGSAALTGVRSRLADISSACSRRTDGSVFDGDILILEADDSRHSVAGMDGFSGVVDW